MIRTQVYIPDDLYQQAKAQARLSGLSISVLLRKGLAIVLKQKNFFQNNSAWFLNDFVGKSEGKKGIDAALHHNDIYS